MHVVRIGYAHSGAKRASKLRLRLRGGRLLAQSPEQFQSEIALEQINFDCICMWCVLATPTPALNAQVNCACAFVAGACSRNRQSNFTLKLL